MTEQAAADALVATPPGVLSQIARKANREILKYAVQKYIFCDFTNDVLDVRRAVLIEGPTRSYVCTTAHWDTVKDSVLTHPATKDKVSIIDGRDYYTASGRAKS